MIKQTDDYDDDADDDDDDDVIVRREFIWPRRKPLQTFPGANIVINRDVYKVMMMMIWQGFSSDDNDDDKNISGRKHQNYLNSKNGLKSRLGALIKELWAF